MASGRFVRTRRRIARTSRSVDRVGEQALFFWRALVWAPRALVHYKKEVLRLIAEISMGTGALAVIGGTVVIVGFLTLFTGGTIAVQASARSETSVSRHSRASSPRSSTCVSPHPVIAGIGLAATIGAGSTAQLGAMRVSEEIDALESMAIPSVPYLVSTRVMAGMIAIVPLYSLAVIASFVASRFATVFLYDHPPGVYDPYFSTFLNPTDILWSFAQAIAMALAVMLIHTYYGFNASGGPVGVGVAVGNAVRASLIAVVTVTLLIPLAIYGQSGNFNRSG
ncbi:ABC transporter permease [Rhodococcus hoagii]|nr:ABC transporter permease [Prescottella equi]